MILNVWKHPVLSIGPAPAATENLVCVVPEAPVPYLKRALDLPYVGPHIEFYILMAHPGMAQGPIGLQEL